MQLPAFAKRLFVLCAIVGAHTYKAVFLPDAREPTYVSLAVQRLRDDTPAYFHISKDGESVKKGPLLTHADLLAQPQWSFVSNLVSSKYFECDN